MYDSAMYAATRINYTVVMCKRVPVIVQKVTRDKVVVGTTIGRKPQPVKAKLSDLNVTNLKLGYFNCEGVAYYMSRKAMRNDWRQGLRTNNVECTPRKYNLDIGDIAQCLRQRYPALGEAMHIAGKGGSCAWCSEFCVNSKGVISWKSHAVGSVVDGTIELANKFKFLAKLLKENTHECYEVI
jgi:hypothetical protein